jgi:hypothetical protein
MDQVVKRSQNSNQQQPVAPVKAAQPKQKHYIKYIVLVFAVILVLGGGFMAKQKMMRNDFAGAVNKDRYQAIFLTNGQVYFGKIDKISGTGYTLKDIYYLQVQQGVQGENAQQQNPDQNQNLSLAKLGSELHGPEDVMYIEGKQVLFWENLKTDGQVAKAIQANQNKK